MAGKIKADKKLFKNDVVKRRELKQKHADELAEDVAAASQEREGGDSDKKKALKRKLHLK